MTFRLVASSLLLLSLAACAPTVRTPPDVPTFDAPSVDVVAVDVPTVDAVVDASMVDVPVEAPTRLPMCTSQFGHALTRVYGRLDGHLVAIVPPGSRGCNGDPDHLHLQVAMGGAVYDVAVNLGARPTGGMPDLAVATNDVALPDGQWVEGWHPMVAPLDYARVLHLHAGDFTSLAPADVAARLEAELRDVDRIAVFATAYGPDGVHDVHRSGGMDGALALHPAGARAHLLLFRFSSQVF